MASTAFTAIMEALFNEPTLTGREIEGRLGYKFTAATIGATSLTTTDANIVKLGSQYLSERFQGWHIHLATASEDRVITTISITGSTATMNFLGGGNATTQAGATTCYLTRPTWPELKAATNTVLEYIPCACLDVLRHGPDDAFMQASATTAWTGTNATVAKQTTAAEVLHGQRSTSLTLSAGAGYMTGTTSRIGQSEGVLAHVLAKADIGTATIRVLDQSGNTISTDHDVSLTQEQWMYIRKAITVDADDEGVAFRILGTDNLDQIDVQGAWFVNQAENVFPLPSYIDAPFKLKAVTRRVYMQGGHENDTWLARSYHDFRLLEGVDYRFTDFPSDANPLGLEMLVDWHRSYPIMLLSEVPYSAPYGVDGSFTNDASTTTCAPHLLLAGLKQWAGGMYGDLFPDARAQGTAEFNKRLSARRSALPELEPWRGPSGGRRI